MVHNSWSLTKKPPVTAGVDRAEAVGSTASPIERDQRSPKGWRKLEPEGVGLGIVVALEKAAGGGGGTSTPIAIVSPRAKGHRWCLEVAAGELGAERTPMSTEAAQKFQVADFLSYCHLCGKRLHGKDIYMYRGEKAFCSSECRYQQIVNDEHQEKFGLDVREPPPEISSSPYSAGDRRLFFMGIVVS